MMSLKEKHVQKVVVINDCYILLSLDVLGVINHEMNLSLFCSTLHVHFLI